MDNDDERLVGKVAAALNSRTISRATAEKMIAEIRLHIESAPYEELRDDWKPDIVIYHADCADGFGAAWACWKRWGKDCEYVAAHYGSHPPDVAGKHVLIVDFSYKRLVLEAMARLGRAASIVILDHHKTSSEDLAAFTHGLCGLGHDNFWPSYKTIASHMQSTIELGRAELPIFARFEMDASGARLAWDFCFPGSKMPLLLKLIEDRDLWRFKSDFTKPFGLWLRSEPFDFERWSEIAIAIEAPYGNEIRAEADAMQRFHDAKINEIASFAYLGRIDDHEPIMVNCPPAFASEVGNLLLDRHPDAPFAATFYDTKDARLFSLRSKDDREDVSRIAARHAGGGHRNAAGFRDLRPEDCRGEI